MVTWGRACLQKQRVSLLPISHWVPQVGGARSNADVMQVTTAAVMHEWMATLYLQASTLCLLTAVLPILWLFHFFLATFHCRPLSLMRELVRCPVWAEHSVVTDSQLTICTDYCPLPKRTWTAAVVYAVNFCQTNTQLKGKVVRSSWF